MSSYEGRSTLTLLPPILFHVLKNGTVEHNIPTQTPPSNSNSNSAAPRRPDFASFYARVTQIDTTATNNPYAVPIPADVSAANRLAAEAYEQIRVRVVSDAGGQDELLAAMVEELLRGVEAPVRKVEGVGDGFLDGQLFFFPPLEGVWKGRRKGGWLGVRGKFDEAGMVIQ